MKTGTFLKLIFHVWNTENIDRTDKIKPVESIHESICYSTIFKERKNEIYRLYEFNVQLIFISNL